MLEITILAIIGALWAALQLVREPDEYITRLEVRGHEIYDRHNGWFYIYEDRTEFVSFPRVRMELIKGLNNAD